MFSRFRYQHRSAQRATVCVFATSVACLWGCATSSPDYRNEQIFSDPKSAVNAFVAAAKSSDTTKLEAIFGPESRDLLGSGDPVADRAQREVLVVALDQEWTLESKGGKSKELIIGQERWPFPIPLVKDSRGWWFDTLAGKQEVLARRIGRNELAVIGTLRTYVIAQKEFASEGHDGKPAGIYAQTVRSQPGKHDGLYWPSADAKEKPSPLGQFAAQAAAEGYPTEAKSGPTPYHGYYFRILTLQGGNAPGGAKNYFVNGDMNAGFAMVAYPVEYGNSGIMTFQVGADGMVYESDLGDGTLKTAGDIKQYNPDRNWHVVE